MSSGVLSVHRGSKVVLSMCVCRFPSKFVEPEFARKFRESKNEWETRTGNKLNIADGLAYLKTPGHFLPSIEEREKRMRRSEEEREQKHRDTSMSEIESLLASEGIPELFNQRTNAVDQGETDSMGRKDQHGESRSETTTSMQYLIVKYKANPDVWTLPFTHRREEESAFESLMRISREHIGSNPHLPSLAPIAFREIVSPGPSTRMFYYKAVNPPNSDVRISEDSDIASYAWVDRDTLASKLSTASWNTLKNAIPLD